MKAILSILILILTVLCAGCISGSNEYSGEKVSFNYPSDWNIIENNSNNVSFDAENLFSAEVVSYNNTDLQTLIDEVGVYRSSSGYDTYEVDTENIDALDVFNTYGPKNAAGIRAVYCDAFIQGKNDEIWYITVNGPGAEGIEDSFEMIVNSFKIK